MSTDGHCAPPASTLAGEQGQKAPFIETAPKNAQRGSQTVIGLDISLTRTGIALWRDGHMTTTSTVSQPIGAQSWDERNTRIVGQTGSIIRWLSHNAWTDGQPYADLAVIEAPILHGPQTGSFFDRSGLWHGVYSKLRSSGWRIPVAVVNVATLKAWATGKGNADKAMMLHAARREWPGIPNHDEADSAWLAAMGAAKLGHDPVEMTAWRVSGLAKGDWPLDGLETL